MAGETETKKQENGSRIVLESVIENGKFPTTSFIEKVYPDVPAKWVDTYKLQSDALKKYLKSNRGYNYSRDEGIMPWLMGVAGQYMDVRTPAQQNSWNPMDILLVKKQGENRIKEKINKIAKINGLTPTDKLIKLNLYMKDLLKKKVMIPISLKGIKAGIKQASIEESNLTAGSKGVDIKIIPGTLFCDLDVTKPPLFDTGEFTFKIQVDDEIVKVQVRSFRYSKPSTVIQTDLTPLGRKSGAKLGKVASSAISDFLSKLGLQRPQSPTQDNMIATDGKFSDSQIKFWDNLYKKIKDIRIENEKVNWDAPLELGRQKVTFKKIIEYSLENKDKDRNVLGRLFSKLVTLKHIQLYQSISKKKKFDEWLSVLYYGAKKEFSDTNGPFIKIY
jgi:hypothetical protein